MKSANDFIERRNSVTDRMVNSYGEKMKSVEQNLEKLNGLRDAMEFQTAVQEVDLAEQMGRLNTLDAEHKKIEAALRNAGQLDKNGEHPMLIRMADEIKMGKEKIAAAEAKTQMKSFSIYAEIVETKDKVGTYRAKQKEFSLIKERNAPILKNTSESARKETSEAELERSPVAESFTATEHLAESSRLTIGSFLDKWNEHLKESLPDSERSTLNIDKAEFLKGARWGESRELEYEQFLKVVEGYYRKNRIDFKERATIGEKFKESKIDKK